MKQLLSISIFCICVAFAIAGSLQAAATPKEAVGFFGSVTGTIKSTEADGSSFTIEVKSAVPEAKSAVKDVEPMVGKILTLGTRMPHVDGKPTHNADDVLYVKSLAVGDEITIKVFATRASPDVLRMQAPGAPATTAPTTAISESK